MACGILLPPAGHNSLNSCNWGGLEIKASTKVAVAYSRLFPVLKAIET